VVPREISLMDDKAREGFIKRHRDFRPKLIVIDTLAACSVGANELQIQDMTKLVAACKELMRAFARSDAVLSAGQRIRIWRDRRSGNARRVRC